MSAKHGGVVEVPYCRVCRRSSELKWRKHVFSKNHQRAAAELLTARVADMVDTREQIIAARGEDIEQLRVAKYCVFCESKLESLRLWIQHHASAEHRSKLYEFCKHHRCDASQALRPQLCLTDEDAISLTTAMREKLPDPKPTTEEECKASVPSPTIHQPSQAHAQAFLESATTRLHQVRSGRGEPTDAAASPPADATVDTKVSWMGPHSSHFVRARTVTSPDGIQQNPLGRHEGRRVWGGGIVKIKKSDWIPWGVDMLVAAEEERGLGDVTSSHAMNDTSQGSNSTFQHRWTESARGAGLTSISRVDWGDSVANVHSAAAVPPWMVETEDEYRRCNTTQRRSGGGKDIFVRLEGAAYDEASWLPNFGSVWQEGSRRQTRKAFQKMQPREPPRRDVRASPVAFQPLRSTQPSQVVEVSPPEEVSVSAPAAASTQASPCASSAPVVEPPTAATPTNLDTKKMLLLAQKERLRAKLAAKRHAPASGAS